MTRKRFAFSKTRNKFEEKVQEGLIAQFGAANVKYEKETLTYTKPASVHKYTPDFKVTSAAGHIVYIESKGYLTIDDRKKMLLVCAQHPAKDIRMLFQYPNRKIRKGSPTSYTMWAHKHGIQTIDPATIIALIKGKKNVEK